MALTFQPKVEYIFEALLNPFIQFQVKIGIYDMENIWDDFLGIAKSIVHLNQVVVCLDLLNNQLEGLTPELAEAYVRCVAAHEAHHFEHGHDTSVDMLEQAHRERDCNTLIAERYPHLNAMREEAETRSVVMQRVFQRVNKLKKAS